MSGAAWRFVISLLAFGVWIGYLAQVALTNSPGATLAPAQLLLATHYVVAEVEVGSDQRPTGQIRVVERLRPTTNDVPDTCEILHLAAVKPADGFRGPGKYFIPLQKRDSSWGLAISPWSVLSDEKRGRSHAPLIYLWTDSLQRQWTAFAAELPE